MTAAGPVRVVSVQVHPQSRCGSWAGMEQPTMLTDTEGGHGKNDETETQRAADGPPYARGTHPSALQFSSEKGQGRPYPLRQSLPSALQRFNSSGTCGEVPTVREEASNPTTVTMHAGTRSRRRGSCVGNFIRPSWRCLSRSAPTAKYRQHGRVRLSTIRAPSTAIGSMFR